MNYTELFKDCLLLLKLADGNYDISKDRPVAVTDIESIDSPKLREIHGKICDAWPAYQAKKNKAKAFLEYYFSFDLYSLLEGKNLFAEESFRYVFAYIIDLYMQRRVYDYFEKNELEPIYFNYEEFLAHNVDNDPIGKLTATYNKLIYLLRINEDHFKSERALLERSSNLAIKKNQEKLIKDDDDEATRNHKSNYPAVSIETVVDRIEVAFKTDINKCYTALLFVLPNEHDELNKELIGKLQPRRDYYSNESVNLPEYEGKDHLKQTEDKLFITQLKRAFRNDEIFAGAMFKFLNKSPDKYRFYEIMMEAFTKVTSAAKLLAGQNSLNPKDLVSLCFQIEDSELQLFNLAISLNSNLNEADKIMNGFIRNKNTIVQDLLILEGLLKDVHNLSKGDNKYIFNALIKNKNIYNYSKSNIIKKLIQLFINILNTSEDSTVEERIAEAEKRNLISTGFKERYDLIRKILENNSSVSASDANSKLISQLETDIEILKTLDALIELDDSVQPKNPKLFELSLQVNDQMRFRVLEDKDPYHFRVGLDTDCCQRIGGEGEEAAKDSYVNGQAGILVLEHVGPKDWEVLSQSYFHYVPQHNGIILDNVEHNDANVKKYNVDLNDIYANYAVAIKSKLNLNYILCGKAYNSLDNDKFTSTQMRRDPRVFVVDEPYTDFDVDDHIDLTQSKSVKAASILGVYKLSSQFVHNILESN